MKVQQLLPGILTMAILEYISIIARYTCNLHRATNFQTFDVVSLTSVYEHIPLDAGRL